METYQITALGKKAWQLLMTGEIGEVWGTPSQGVFISIPPRGMIFISRDSYRGPITANLRCDKLLLRDLRPGDPVSMTEGCLVFPSSGYCLAWEKAKIWESPEKPTEVLPSKEVLEHYQSLRQNVQALREPSDLSFVNWKNQPGAGLEVLLGQGDGLTPAGDDLILGCLLSQVRWGGTWFHAPGGATQGKQLAAMAYDRTTLLSANLIACAAEGQADERLIATLDAIFTGQPAIERCVDYLLSYGHSSGVWVLEGIGIVISQIKCF